MKLRIVTKFDMMNSAVLGAIFYLNEKKKRKRVTTSKHFIRNDCITNFKPF